ncbi:sulfatase-like hydrolase/transferase [Pelagicoccus enzymogenes]|uniref:sulfatase-like hydrolase/transferase n=1 Tax=Pelagicoccus enzymogenes TaxID=2773457 RepID=UPI00280E617D|nr:sulfatase-like hydrolase/transferase [Pelagicoccus enzymogenes]MDQ8198590.1 sulfatase-like hydrolase/transferase [Pelagicoccus enzymogenes]
MKKTKFVIPLLAVISCLSSIIAAKQPNVVLIISDDQTWSDYGFMGHPHLETPNLDKSFSESLLYERG